MNRIEQTYTNYADNVEVQVSVTSTFRPISRDHFSRFILLEEAAKAYVNGEEADVVAEGSIDGLYADITLLEHILRSISQIIPSPSFLLAKGDIDEEQYNRLIEIIPPKRS